MDLKQYLPSFYLNSNEIISIQDALSIEDEGLKTAIDDIISQIFIDTATWGLDLWEKYLGLDVNPNGDFEFRRSKIKSKLRGQGTITVKLIKNVAESFANGEVEVIEKPNDYSFAVKFVGSKGIPPNLDDLKETINEIKPAHLAVTYEFTFTIWEEVKALTWGQVKTSTWDDLKSGRVI